MQAFEAKKKEGNDAFSSGRFQEAYDIYTECLTIDPQNNGVNSTLLCNRAAASMKVLRSYHSLIKAQSIR